MSTTDLFGKQLSVDKFGHKYYAEKDERCACVTEHGIIWVDPDVMESIIRLKLHIGFPIDRQAPKIPTVLKVGTIIKSVTKHSTLLEYVLQLQSDKFCFTFIDGNNYNLLRSNIIIYHKLIESNNDSNHTVSIRITKNRKDNKTGSLKYDTVTIDTYMRKYIEDKNYVVCGKGEQAHLNPSSKLHPSFMELLAHKNSKILQRLSKGGLLVNKVYRLDSTKLDYSRHNVGLFIQRSRTLDHDAVIVTNGLPPKCSYLKTNGKITGIKLTVSFNGYKIITSESLTDYSMNDLKLMMLNYSSDVERIIRYSLYEIVRNNGKFNEIKKLINGKLFKSTTIYDKFGITVRS